MKSPNTPGDLEILSHVDGSELSAGWKKKIPEYFLRAAAVGAGMFVGGILALVIGLHNGWIEIRC